MISKVIWLNFESQAIKHITSSITACNPDRLHLCRAYFRFVLHYKCKPYSGLKIKCKFISGLINKCKLFSGRDIERKFGIGNSRLTFWLKELGYDYQKAKSVPLSLMIESSTPTPEANDSINKLKRELEDSKLLAEAYRRMIEVAELELKIEIRKKSNTK